MDIDKLLNLGDNQPKQKSIVGFVGRCAILGANSAFAKILAPPVCDIMVLFGFFSNFSYLSATILGILPLAVRHTLGAVPMLLYS